VVGKDTRLDRSVAVKILPAGFAQDDERRQRFEREAKTISSLNHPHIWTRCSTSGTRATRTSW
jgi:serine/threonine protein kinase